jgi:hypothetical protein
MLAVASSAYKEQFLGILFGYAAPTVWTTGRHQSASLSFFFSCVAHHAKQGSDG